MLTACGIETHKRAQQHEVVPVATVLTACGIETDDNSNRPQKLLALQQCLPLAVLKLQASIELVWSGWDPVATVLTACGIET